MSKHLKELVIGCAVLIFAPFLIIGAMVWLIFAMLHTLAKKY